MNNTILDELHRDILRDEARLRAKKRRLLELAAKYSKRSLAQMFPSESGIEKGSIDYRQDA